MAMTVNAKRRPGLTRAEVVSVLALLLLGAGLLLTWSGRARAQAQRGRSLNNLRQLALALHSYHDAHAVLPPGLDDNGFSAASRLLPYVEQEDVYKQINFKKPIFDRSNDAARKAEVAVFLSPDDPIKKVRDGCGATNYLYNDRLFFLDSRSRIPASFPDGTANTIVIGETLKGDGKTTADSVQRQYVILPKYTRTGIKPDAGVANWKGGRDIAGDRCDCWVNGRFLHGTFNGTLKPNDEYPDVSCGGAGGLSAARSLTDRIRVAVGDGSARELNAKKLSFETWKNAMDPADGNPLGNDW
jgi:hypothetical protein